MLNAALSALEAVCDGRCGHPWLDREFMSGEVDSVADLAYCLMPMIGRLMHSVLADLQVHRRRRFPPNQTPHRCGVSCSADFSHESC